jgi:cytoskeletal protein CcmA (bactofilin family)
MHPNTWDTNLGRARIYKDAILIDEQATISFPSTTRSVIIGENLEATPQPGTDPFVGLIDQLGFWTKELTIDEITDLFLNPAFDRTVISGDTVRTGRIISNATGVGGNPKSVFNLDLGSFYAGDGGFTFGTDTFIYWDPAAAELYVSGDVTISGTLSGVDGTFSGNLSSTGVITFTTLQNTTQKMELSGTNPRLQISPTAEGWNETGPIGTGYIDIDGYDLKLAYRHGDGVWRRATIDPSPNYSRVGLEIRGDINPQTTATYDLGQGSHIWRNGNFSGTVSTNIISANSATISGAVTASNASISGLTLVGALQVDGGGDAIREIQVANVTIGANDSVLLATFIGSGNTVIAVGTNRENSTTGRDNIYQYKPGNGRIEQGSNRT